MKKNSDTKNPEKEDEEKPGKSIVSKFLKKFNFAHESVEHFVFGRSKPEVSKAAENSVGIFEALKIRRILGQRKRKPSNTSCLGPQNRRFCGFSPASKPKVSKAEHEHNDSKESENSKSGDKGKKHDPHGFPMISDLLGLERVKNIKSKKNKILMCTGTFTGILLIIFGAVMITGSADRVADNVVFGEKEVFSVFLILAGILLIACSFAYKFLGKSFFKGIDNDIESYDKKSSDSAKNNR